MDFGGSVMIWMFFILMGMTPMQVALSKGWNHREKQSRMSQFSSCKPKNTTTQQQRKKKENESEKVKGDEE